MLNKEDLTLIRELNLDKFTEEQQIQYLTEFYGAYSKKVSMAFQSLLSEDQLDEFDAVDSKGDDEATEAWLRKTVPNYDKIISDQLTELKKDIREEVSAIHSVIEKAKQ